MPSGPGIRVDTAVEAGDRVPAEYDPLIAKLIVHAEDRPRALERLRRALDEAEVGGIQTTIPFHRAMLDEPGFVDATDLSTTWVDGHWDGSAARAPWVRAALIAAGLVALEDGMRPAVAGVGEASGSSGGRRSAWRDAGRADAIDRWPT